VPDAANLAQMIAEVRAQYGEIDRHLIAINDASPASGQAAAQPAASQGRTIPVARRSDTGIDAGFEGAPA
jgi:hypothetical protein